MVFIAHVRRDLAVLQDTHDDSSTTMSASVLRQIVATRELLAALIALEGLILSVERAVVTLEVFLTAEATRAKLANKGLGWVLGQGLFASSAVDWSRWIITRGFRGRGGIMTIIGTRLAWTSRGRWSLRGGRVRLSITSSGDVCLTVHYGSLIVRTII